MEIGFRQPWMGQIGGSDVSWETLWLHCVNSIDHPLSMKITDIDEWSADCATLIPFAAVSMVNVDEESYEVSTLGLNGKEAMSFLTEQVENELNFTYEETIKTAFGALLYFWDDIKADDVKACVLRKGEETEKQLSSEEIKECLSMAPLLK